MAIVKFIFSNKYEHNYPGAKYQLATSPKFSPSTHNPDDR